MTNYEKAITKAFDKIDRLVELGFTTKEIADIVTGMTIAFDALELLTPDELATFRAKCLDRI